MNDSGIIKYGISMNYVGSWGYKEAIREIVQNFKDYGEYDFIENPNEIQYLNRFKPTDTSFLKIGFTRKDNPNAVGKHGEGLKMALLVLKRLNVNVLIDAHISGMHYQMRPTTYIDAMLGTCFGIEYQSSPLHDTSEAWFHVTVDRTPEYDEMSDHFITDETEIIYEHEAGNIVDMPAGNVYVGGIFVTKYEDLPRAYDIKAVHVDLGRDRNFPSTFDIEYWTSQIVESYMQENVDDVESFSAREVKHVHTLPEEYVKNVEPTMLHGEMKFKTNSGMLPDRLEEAARNDREVQLKIKKLNDMLTKRKSPTDLLKMFKSKHASYMQQEAIRDFDVIIDKSTNWNS